MAGAKVEKVGKSKGGLLTYIIVALVAIVVVFGAGVGGFFVNKMLIKSKPVTIIKTVTAPPADSTTGTKPVVSAKTLALDPFLVNLTDPGTKRYLKIQIILGYQNVKLDTELPTKTPILRDSILTVLRSKSSSDFTTLGIEGLKKQLKDVLNPFLTSAKLNNIYLNDILVQ